MGMKNQTVTESLYKDKYRQFNVQNKDFDKYPSQLGERKVADVIGNIHEALDFLERSGDDRAKQALEEFYRHFPKKPKLNIATSAAPAKKAKQNGKKGK